MVTFGDMRDTGLMENVEVQRDGQWWPGTIGLWREDERGWVATARYAANGRQYTETIEAARLRDAPKKVVPQSS
jgi:hypothetical protein